MENKLRFVVLLAIVVQVVQLKPLPDDKPDAKPDAKLDDNPYGIPDLRPPYTTTDATPETTTSSLPVYTTTDATSETTTSSLPEYTTTDAIQEDLKQGDIDFKKKATDD